MVSMSTQHAHPQLGSTFHGTAITSDGITLNQFKGIKYGNIPGRFKRAQPFDGLRGETVIKATEFGPRCPQLKVDIRHLLRIPEDFVIHDEPEDEFECLNLDITLPGSRLSEDDKPLPVLIWIYGGSQAVTFCSAASKICDPSRIVADSVKARQPIIFVSLHYRLNIFAFGDGNGVRNLAVKDQRLGIDWVRKHIVGFGGDPDNITLAGESAGAAYVHAHLIAGPPVKRAILASGSLNLSPPMPLELGQGMINSLNERTSELEQKSIRDCSVAALLQAMDEQNVNRMWLQDEDELRDWQTKPEQVAELMIGDTEYESVIWRNGIELLTAIEIVSAFESKDAEWGRRLRKMYQIVSDRPTASKVGALDFVQDARFSLPAEIIAEKVTTTQPHPRVYRYLVDEPNPWQRSARAHHAVDLIFLFGGLDLSHNAAAETVGYEMRRRWIAFVNGDEPWSEYPTGKKFAYGPFGEAKEVDDRQYAMRRRVMHMKLLREAGPAVYGPILAALTAGRISLLN